MNSAPPAGDGRGRNPARGGRLQVPPRGQAPALPPASRRRAGGARAGDERFCRESDRSGRARPPAAPPARRRGSTHTAGVRVPPAERRARARSGGGGTGGRKGASYPPQGSPRRVPRRAGVPLVAATIGGAQARACNDKRGTKAAHASRHQRRRATAGSALQSARPGASHAARPRALHGRCCPYRAAGEPCEPFKGRSGASCAAPRGLLPSPAAGELCEPLGALPGAPKREPPLSAARAPAAIQAAPSASQGARISTLPYR